MYGGDEVSALVVDLGSELTKAGYAGEDAPKVVMPSAVGVMSTQDEDVEMKDAENDEKNEDGSTPSKKKVNAKRRGRYVGSGALGVRRDTMELVRPIREGIVQDWDTAGDVLTHAFRCVMYVDIHGSSMCCEILVFDLCMCVFTFTHSRFSLRNE